MSFSFALLLFIISEGVSIYLLSDLLGGWLVFLWLVFDMVLGFSLIFMLNRKSNLSDIFKLLNNSYKQPIDFLALLLACFLFIFPGFMSDIVAIILIIPVSRKFLYKMFYKYWLSKSKFGVFFRQDFESKPNKNPQAKADASSSKEAYFYGSKVDDGPDFADYYSEENNFAGKAESVGLNPDLKKRKSLQVIDVEAVEPTESPTKAPRA